MPSSEAGLALNSADEGVSPDAVRKVRLHKVRPASAVSTSGKGDAGDGDSVSNAALDRRIAELIPGIADLSVSQSAQTGSMKTASTIRQKFQSKEEAHRKELKEIASIFDMDEPHPVDTPSPEVAKAWKQTMRPQPKKIQLSQYQVEMINYQRMLLRKNIWYYRDRMNIPRGPCPVHVLKEAWVQGVIDENTLVWGQGLADWLPAKNVKLLLPMVRTPEVRLGAWIKRTFALKPALNRIREARKEQRNPELLSQQVDRMR